MENSTLSSIWCWEECRVSDEEAEQSVSIFVYSSCLCWSNVSCQNRPSGALFHDLWGVVNVVHGTFCISMINMRDKTHNTSSRGFSKVGYRVESIKYFRANLKKSCAFQKFTCTYFKPGKKNHHHQGGFEPHRLWSPLGSPGKGGMEQIWGERVIGSITTSSCSLRVPPTETAEKRAVHNMRGREGLQATVAALDTETQKQFCQKRRHTAVWEVKACC